MLSISLSSFTLWALLERTRRRSPHEAPHHAPCRQHATTASPRRRCPWDGRSWPAQKCRRRRLRGWPVPRPPTGSSGSPAGPARTSRWSWSAARAGTARRRSSPRRSRSCPPWGAAPARSLGRCCTAAPWRTTRWCRRPPRRRSCTARMWWRCRSAPPSGSCPCRRLQ